MALVPRQQTRRLALLIDADNAGAKLIEPLLGEAAKYGTANVKRIYGDWTTPNLGSWKNVLNRFAIQPVQQFRYTAGKNASDSALIIDAMDLLHSGHVDGFCIVSSDSDFTRLACRIRESGLVAYGFGEKKTPEAFVRACDQFVYVENLVPPESDDAKSKPKQVIGKAAAAPPAAVAKLVRSAYDALAPEGGWVTLAALRQQLLKLSPSFDSRTYGFQKLSDLIASLDHFCIENRADGKSGEKILYVALKT